MEVIGEKTFGQMGRSFLKERGKPHGDEPGRWR
jgi:hypothetical protein